MRKGFRENFPGMQINFLSFLYFNFINILIKGNRRRYKAASKDPIKKKTLLSARLM
jgi:hypothetical protein